MFTSQEFFKSKYHYNLCFLDKEANETRAEVPCLWYSLRNWSPLSWPFHDIIYLAQSRIPVKAIPTCFLSRDEALKHS